MFRLLRRGPGFYRNMLRLVLPIMLQNLVSVSLALFDTFMVGMLGEAPMSAVTLANSPIFVIQLLTFGFQSGSAVLISQYWGKGDTASISRVIGIALYVAGAVSLAFALALFFAPVQIMDLLTNNAELAAIAARYARIVGFSYFFNTLSSVYLGAHRSMENPRIGLRVFTVSMVTNTFFNWVLIFGKLGFPALGVVGAALGTLLARTLELLITILYAVRNERFPLHLEAFLRPGREMAARFLRYSSPVVFNETFWGLGTSLVTVVLAHMEGSTEILAAYTIAGNAERLFTVLLFSIAASSGIIIGKEIGAGRRAAVYEIGGALQLLSVLAGAVMGLFMHLAIAGLFVPYVYPLFHLSAGAGVIATMMLRIRATMLPLVAFCTTNVVGILRGGGDVRTAAMIDLLPLWILTLPLVTVTALVLKSGILAVTLCTFADTPVKILTGIARYRSRKWIRDVTSAMD